MNWVSISVSTRDTTNTRDRCSAELIGLRYDENVECFASRVDGNRDITLRLESTKHFHPPNTRQFDLAQEGRVPEINFGLDAIYDGINDFSLHTKDFSLANRTDSGVLFNCRLAVAVDSYFTTPRMGYVVKNGV